MATEKADLFSTQGQHYKSFRPTYPAELYAEIFKYADLNEHNLAVDLATGSGQAIGPLVERFNRILGIDASENQLKSATAYPNVEYQSGDVHNLSLSDSCANLVTVGQAMHWFDLQKFYLEVNRILKPGGVLAVWTYDTGVLNKPESPENAVFARFMHKQLGPYWDERRQLVEERYPADMDPPADIFTDVQRRLIPMPTPTTVSRLLGYARSLSGLATYRQREGEQAVAQLLESFQADILDALGTADLEHPLVIHYPLTLLLARKPLSS